MSADSYQPPNLKKPRSPLQRLPEEAQAAVIKLLDKGTQEDAINYCSEQHGFAPSPQALSGFYPWWHTRQRLLRNASKAEALQERYAKQNPKAAMEEIRAVGQLFFSEMAIDEGDSLTWRRVQLNEEGLQKVDVAKERTRLTAEALQLAKAKHQRETGELILKYIEDHKVLEIAHSGVSQEQKMGTLLEHIFGSDLVAELRAEKKQTEQ